VCCSRFLLLNKLGKGGFGLIYSGIDLENNVQVAIKLEDTTRARKKYLKQEFQIYQRYHSDWTYLPFNQQATIPNIYYYGRDDKYRVLVMDLLGPSLSELFTFQYEKFTLKTVLMLAIKMITTVEHLHSKGMLHRDIKPGNFVLGRGVHGNDLYLIDYGLASPYIDNDGRHIPYSTTARFHGTDKYASKNNHEKIEPGRRDDMESLGYLLVYFLSGNLPWSLKHAKVKKKYRRVAYGQSKTETSIEELTEGLPRALRSYFTHVSSLYFPDKPDYCYCRDIFRAALAENHFQFDNVFDWTVLDEDSSSTTSATHVTTKSDG